MWRGLLYYLSLFRDLPGLFVQAHSALLTIVLAVACIVTFVNPEFAWVVTKIGRRLSGDEPWRVPRRWAILPLGLLLLTANYERYDRATSRYSEAESTITKQGAEIERLSSYHPLLSGMIERYEMIEESVNAPHSVVIMLWVSISNLGDQSIAKGWSFTGIAEDSTTVRARPRVFPVSVNSQAPYRVHYDVSDFLANKAMTPIAQGGEIRGYLVFEIPSETARDMAKQGTKYQLTFRDVTEHSYMITYIVPRQVPFESRYLPGTALPQ